jgi:hypothetical protein
VGGGAAAGGGGAGGGGGRAPAAGGRGRRPPPPRDRAPRPRSLSTQPLRPHSHPLLWLPSRPP